MKLLPTRRPTQQEKALEFSQDCPYAITAKRILYSDDNMMLVQLQSTPPAPPQSTFITGGLWADHRKGRKSDRMWIKIGLAPKIVLYLRTEVKG